MDDVTMRFAICFLFFGSVLADNTTKLVYTSCDSCTDWANTSMLENMRLHLYTGNTTDEYQSVIIGNASDLVEETNATKPTVFYIHGWNEGPSKELVRMMINAYLTRGDHNVLVVNYEEIAAMSWGFCFRSFDGIAYQMVTALNALVEAGLDSTTLYILGQSLGAQFTGYVGRNVNFNVSRIIALDPAGPKFPKESTKRLQDTDADFVLVLHSETSMFAEDYLAGDADFVLNSGESPQPGCNVTSTDDQSRVTELLCSHRFAVVVYAESLEIDDDFYGRACDSLADFRANTCNSSEIVIFGYETPITTRGTFFLQTGSASPYGRGISGATYEA